MDSSVSPKDEIWFLRVCHSISTGLYHRPHSSLYLPRTTVPILAISAVPPVPHMSVHRRCFNPGAFALLPMRYIGNRRIFEDLGVPFFADHIRSLTEIYHSMLGGVGNPLLRQFGIYLHWPRVGLGLPSVPRETGVDRLVGARSTATAVAPQYYFLVQCVLFRDRGGTVLKVLCHKSEDRWFDPRSLI